MFKLYVVRKHTHSVLPTFTIGEEVIENVHKWSHLGHTFNDRLSDDDDIMIRRNCLIRQVNNFTCQFSMIDAPLRNMLFLKLTAAVIMVVNCGI